MADIDVLRMMSITSAAERKAGTGGWCRPPETLVKQCDELVENGYAEAREGGWYRTTPEGDRKAALTEIKPH